MRHLFFFVEMRVFRIDSNDPNARVSLTNQRNLTIASHIAHIGILNGVLSRNVQPTLHIYRQDCVSPTPKNTAHLLQCT